MGTMIGVHGPAISLVLQHEEPGKVRAILGAFFVIGYFVAVLALTIVGLFGVEEILLGLLLFPGAVIGYCLAPLISRHINHAILRTAIIVVSSVNALVILVN
jgi:hypothetical protein